MTERHASDEPPGPGEPAVDTEEIQALTIGVLSGTGDQGRGLARRFAMAGHQVLIGSRSPERAAAAAAGLSVGSGLRGLDNAEAAAQADVAFVTVPWPGHHDLLASLEEELAGKIVVDCANPMGFDKKGAYPIEVSEGSAAEQAAALLPRSRVVAAFQNLSAMLLLDPELDTIEQDVLVLGDDREATDTVQALACELPGVRGIYAGRLRNSGQVEAMTANLLSMNRRYKAHAGLRVTDI